MSTVATVESPQCEIEYDHQLHAFLRGLETSSFLSHPGQLRERLIALDKLDSEFGGVDFAGCTRCTDPRIHKRVTALRTRLEAANAELYSAVRADIDGSARGHLLFQWLQNVASTDETQIPLSGMGFDCQDELLSGVLQLREPAEPNLRLSPEIVFYQPTPVRHILDLIAVTRLSEDDLFIDLGSGLGHVPLLVSMLTGARSLGIEVQKPYVVSARECAESLQLSRARFINQDAREANLSQGTVFYLYSPFKGSILAGVLNALRMESRRRSIKVCSLGSCTYTVANETWLKASSFPDGDRITVFESQ